MPSGVAGTLTGEYRYTSITPVTLTANTTYTIGAYYLNNPDAYAGSVLSGNITTASGVAYGAARGIPGNAFPTTDAEGIPNYVNANFKFTVLSGGSAPEPGTLALLALGMVGGIVARRRK